MPPSPTTLLRSAHLDGRTVDVLLRHGLVAAIGAGLEAPAGADVVDLDGRWLGPGMWDNHVHLDEHALNRTRLDLSGATSAAAAAALVGERLRAGAPAEGLPLVGSGFRDALWADAPGRALLDGVSGEVPVVLVSADLHCCWVNSAATRRYGHAGDADGIVRETAGQELRIVIGRVPREALDRQVAAVVAEAAARGTVGVVDFQEPWQLATWRARLAGGAGALRVAVSVWPSHLDDAVARGLRTGDEVAGTGGLLTMGPLKILTDGSLNTRTAYCHEPYAFPPDAAHPCGMLLVPPDELEPLMRRATAAGIDVAAHAIGDRANGLVLDAFAATGARGRIEHAQLLSDADVGRFAALGVVASVQPEHAVDDRDVADRHWAGRTHRAFAYRSLLDAGAGLALGSDAPVAPLDPWITLAAAVRRSGDDRPSWHPEQEIPVDVALAASAGPDGPVTVGRRADLVVTDLDPRTADPAALRAMPVAGTLLGGHWTHRDGL
ncbi:amidohydrolase family protein [Pseudonocardia sp. KRD-184]|uniref:Amidohydrolase family protein n=1 Tax=Pseudonocardia oceani TaxID=2792013 RepID=A0ABS6U446_9PSEU|nr:amidohydrolase family protein [Pseudonocardia oceani]MBW0093683.1 amidohydrolase family protein [Pseudonocardia oceani]MBW0099859.1 amidohydrolase family protein [Pseudonocardia oceani]MBW0112506.1 amidohydrolase family protein [Pseudonocardia oceani]MBW0125457.1 amidohydrolase family protein [Pseudonocardia oceani]MBW0126761.1 amidohydrolase family protein [Pseudonocardia oceani]